MNDPTIFIKLIFHSKEVYESVFRLLKRDLINQREPRSNYSFCSYWHLFKSSQPRINKSFHYTSPSGSDARREASGGLLGDWCLWLCVSWQAWHLRQIKVWLCHLSLDTFLKKNGGEQKKGAAHTRMNWCYLCLLKWLCSIFSGLGFIETWRPSFSSCHKFSKK